MSRRLSLTRSLGLVAMLLVAVSVGCSAKEARYPADYARYQRIDKAVEALSKAYVKKDASAFHALLLPSDRTDKMEAWAIKDFDTFQDITLDLAIERIVIDGDQIDVFVHWHGLWKREQEETEQRERGHGMLRWMGVQSILLAGYDGDIPFGISLRHKDSSAPSSVPSR
ncbi:MAG: hypothetical protein KGI53_07170 [Nitrospirota bacterium]|nr:hypothetical protein [Nitrospirota bacterium]